MSSKTISVDHYLKTIYLLEQKKGVVRSVDIADALGYSKPSITRAVAVLKEMGYITTNNHDIYLTADGKKEAAQLLQKYDTICKFLISLGVSKDSALHDACALEHSISGETLEKFVSKIED